MRFDMHDLSEVMSKLFFSEVFNLPYKQLKIHVISRGTVYGFL